jgi:hypothetical protein
MWREHRHGMPAPGKLGGNLPCVSLDAARRTQLE